MDSPPRCPGKVLDLGRDLEPDYTKGLHSPERRDLVAKIRNPPNGLNSVAAIREHSFRVLLLQDWQKRERGMMAAQGEEVMGGQLTALPELPTPNMDSPLTMPEKGLDLERDGESGCTEVVHVCGRTQLKKIAIKDGNARRNVSHGAAAEGNRALKDFYFQLALLEEDNRRRSRMARQEVEKDFRRSRIYRRLGGYPIALAKFITIFSILGLCYLSFHSGHKLRSCSKLALPDVLSCLTEDYKDVMPQAEIRLSHSHKQDEIPQYILDYAPLVHLFSEEQFWPCDIAEHLLHITPELDYTPIQDLLQAFNLTNLDQLNEYEKGKNVFLTSNDNVEDRPDWLGGEKNIPDDYTEDAWRNIRQQAQLHATKKVKDYSGGRSDAPAVLITVNKGHGIVDAFWFYFYSYNLGNVVLNIRWGNHVGDWEHSLIRFQHGKPKLVYFSEHNFGSAYSYPAVEKIGKRPVVYSAVGTHAMYATPGLHPYILPLGILHDETDRGPLWDPALNAHTYTYNHLNDSLSASNLTPHAPTEWFYFAGHWGDKLYPLDDDRQYWFGGQYHYVSGPLGPRFKHLGRRKVCQGRYEDPCVIKQWLTEDGEMRIAPPPTDEGGEEGEGWGLA